MAIPRHTSKRTKVLPTENELISFDHAAAGHEGVQSDPSGFLVVKPCTAAENDFYEAARAHPAFQAHMPTFMGTLTLNKHQSQASSLPDPTPSWNPSGGKKVETGLSLVLENVAAGFKRPNVLDLKLGARLWADDAAPAKRQRLDAVSKESTSSSLGFRVAGMKVWDGETATVEDGSVVDENIVIKDGYKCFNKNYGHKLRDAHDVKLAFLDFFGGPFIDEAGQRTETLKPGPAKLIARRIAREVSSIQHVLEHEESRMYSASILMVYEGDTAALNSALREEEGRESNTEEADSWGGESKGGEEVSVDGDDETEPSKVHDVRLIDFAHAEFTPGQGPDENALRGVRSMLQILEELSKEVHDEPSSSM